MLSRKSFENHKVITLTLDFKEDWSKTAASSVEYWSKFDEALVEFWSKIDEVDCQPKLDEI